MTASLNNVVTVTLLPEGRSLSRDNMNVVALMTSQLGHLSTAKRYDVYSNLDAVADDFGTNSDVYDHAAAFFGTRPNAVQAGGSLIIGFWRAANEAVAATAAKLTSKQHTAETLIPQLQAITNGSFKITVDDDDPGEVSLTSLDFSTALTLEDVATIINTALDGDATCVIDNLRFVITSPTTGTTSEMTYATQAASGTYIGTLLGLAAGSGATLVAQGAGAATLNAETKLAAVQALKAEVNFKGFVFIGQTTDQEVADLSTWAQAQSVMSYDVFSDSDNLLIDPTNPVWAIKLASRVNYRCLFSKANNRKFATSYMARMHVVNFNAENTALTMNLKELSIPAEEYTQGEITACQNVGLDIYTTFKRVPKVLTSGANDFADNPYNLIAYIDAVQTDMFNLLGATATKIPQTQRGVNQIVDQAEKTTRGFVRAGVFAPGTWSSPDTFGNIDVFNRAIEENGFYVLAGQLRDQPQEDRQNRKSPPLQIAVKNAGAIHKVDVIINFNY